MLTGSAGTAFGAGRACTATGASSLVSVPKASDAIITARVAIMIHAVARRYVGKSCRHQASLRQHPSVFSFAKWVRPLDERAHHPTRVLPNGAPAAVAAAEEAAAVAG